MAERPCRRDGVRKRTGYSLSGSVCHHDPVASGLELDHAADVSGDVPPLLGAPVQDGYMHQHQNSDFQPLGGCRHSGASTVTVSETSTRGRGTSILSIHRYPGVTDVSFSFLSALKIDASGYGEATGTSRGVGEPTDALRRTRLARTTGTGRPREVLPRSPASSLPSSTGPPRSPPPGWNAATRTRPTTWIVPKAGGGSDPAADSPPYSPTPQGGIVHSPRAQPRPCLGGSRG